MGSHMLCMVHTVVYLVLVLYLPCWYRICCVDVISAKFQEAKSDYLGPLTVTPERVAKKIKAMKDNKLPGVTISADMKVSEQCGIAVSKSNQILGLIRRNITYKETN